MNISGEKIDSAQNQIFVNAPVSLDEVKRAWRKPDIVVFHEAYRFPYLAIAKQLKSEGIPYFVIPHGELSEQALKKKALKKMVANAIFFNKFIRESAALQLLSDKEMQSTAFKAKKFVATNGIFMPKNVKASFSGEGIRFVYVGRLDAYHKGLDLMMDAIALNADYLRGKRTSFEIYGPDYKGRFANVERLVSERSLGDIVSVSPAVCGKEKEEILLSSDVFLQTSRFEGMPMGILEALSYGLPCALTRGTTMGGFIEEYGAGWIADNTVDSISRMLLEVTEADEDDMWAKSAKARSLAMQEFSWQTVAACAVARYEDLLQSSVKRDDS
ncbi:hypothetical protein DMP11_03180 [Parvibacter caecicola]|nr:hypothetical protein DMP11_03180 [Parvibacter caecicola]